MSGSKKQNSNSTDREIQKLYSAWHESELNALRIFDEVNEDYTHPRYVEAHNQSHALLLELLRPSSSIYGALAKLRVASYCEGYLKDAQDPACTIIASRAIVSAIQDLEIILSDPALYNCSR